ncbi:hypothetical protein EF096_11435 [Pseudomonas neustonica]|uniref:Uncharacterized protein n=1 Tax=Pseudomonas neustonica TaxID=2487346 RepID=A0ABX9XLB6_9PSED|nr:hypothetical protein EF099_12730 [Pseudomonas sp. SSM44]ROZ84050.1 hypothetical protein EF096_11435 [Pseudomonas neustonica]
MLQFFDDANPLTVQIAWLTLLLWRVGSAGVCVCTGRVAISAASVALRCDKVAAELRPPVL